MCRDLRGEGPRRQSGGGVLVALANRSTEGFRNIYIVKREERHHYLSCIHLKKKSKYRIKSLYTTYLKTFFIREKGVEIPTLCSPVLRRFEEV